MVSRTALRASWNGKVRKRISILRETSLRARKGNISSRVLMIKLFLEYENGEDVAVVLSRRRFRCRTWWKKMKLWRKSSTEVCSLVLLIIR